MKKLVGHDFSSESRMPPSVETSAITTLSTSASAGPHGQPLRGRGRRDHERQHEQDADDLDRLGRREREQEEHRDRERAQRHAARGCDFGIDAREEQRPVEQRDAEQDDRADDREVRAAGCR